MRNSYLALLASTSFVFGAGCIQDEAVAGDSPDAGPNDILPGCAEPGGAIDGTIRNADGATRVIGAVSEVQYAPDSALLTMTTPEGTLNIQFACGDPTVNDYEMLSPGNNSIQEFCPTAVTSWFEVPGTQNVLSVIEGGLAVGSVPDRASKCLSGSFVGTYGESGSRLEGQFSTP